MSVFIMRGIPYSGKNWWIKNKLKRHPNSDLKIFTPLDYFRDPVEEGTSIRMDDHRVVEGLKNLRELRDAKADCLLRYLEFLADLFDPDQPDTARETTIVVNDTNIEVEEFSPYYAAADAYQHDVKLVNIICEPSWKEWTRYNRLPEDTGLTPYTLHKLAIRMNKIEVPDHIQQLTVFNSYLPRRDC